MPPEVHAPLPPSLSSVYPALPFDPFGYHWLLL